MTRRRAPGIALAIAAALMLAGCSGAASPRTPHSGELVGTWKTGSARIVVHDDGTFDARDIPSSNIPGATTTGPLSFSGTWTRPKGTYDGYPEFQLFLSSADAGVGGVLMIFDSTTSPVSIGIAGSDPDDPKFLRLSRR